MPIDTVRRILMSEQLQNERATIYLESDDDIAFAGPKYTGFWHCTKSLVKEQGVTRLWRGKLTLSRYGCLFLVWYALRYFFLYFPALVYPRGLIAILSMREKKQGKIKCIEVHSSPTFELSL